MIRKIVNHFATIDHINKQIEEWGELRDEVTAKQKDRFKILDELADVIVLWLQAPFFILRIKKKYGFKIKEIVERVWFKLKRTCKRIDNNHYAK